MKNSNSIVVPVLNNKVLILMEKPSQKTVLQRSEIFSDYLKTKSNFDTYYTLMISAFGFDYPKDIKYKDYPKTSNLSFKLKGNDYEEESIHYDQIIKTNFDYFSQFEELILCPDPDHTGVYSAVLTLEKVLGNNWRQYFKKITYIKLMTYDIKNLNKQLEKLLYYTDNGELNKKHSLLYDKWYEQGKIKRYFEYNYNINSNIFFKEILKKLNINYDLTLSKYMIMTFNLFYNEIDDKGIRESKFIYMMEKYKGSGKYVEKEYKEDESIYFSGIGSQATKFYLVEVLKDLGLINLENKYKEEKLKPRKDPYSGIIKEEIVKMRIGTYFKTELGEKLFSLLSKKTFDVDLPFRLNNWMELDFEDAKILIDKYLLETFKTQKRKNKHLN